MKKDATINHNGYKGQANMWKIFLNMLNKILCLLQISHVEIHMEKHEGNSAKYYMWVGTG